MTPRKTLAQVRKLLAAPGFSEVRQGIALAEATGDPGLLATVCRGVSVDGEGAVRWGQDSEVARRVKGHNRGSAALEMMRVSGAMASVERLSLDWDPPFRLASIAGAPRLAHLEVTCAPGIDLSPLATLPALRHVTFFTRLPEVALLEALQGVTSLALVGAPRRPPQPRLKRLEALPGLRRLCLLRAHGLQSLKPLSALRQLTELEIFDCVGLVKLTGLGELSQLERLSLRACARVTSYTPIARLTNLRSLSLVRQSRVTSAAFARRLRRLESLEISGYCPIRDLSPLSRLPALTRLELSRCSGLETVAPMAGCAQLAEGVTIEDGALCRDGRELAGWTLAAILLGGGLAERVDLSQVRRLTLRGWRDLTDVGFLEPMTGLRELALTNCQSLADVSPLVALGALERVDVTLSARVRPRPPRTALTDRAAVLDWQRAIARALARAGERTQAQDARLAAAKAAGLLRRPAQRAAARARQRGDAETFAQVRRLLTSADLRDVGQGLALLEALDDPALAAEFAEGASIDADGKLQITPESARRAHLRRRDRRGWVALAALRGTGALSGIEALRLERAFGLPDLSSLAGLGALRRLEVAGADLLTDLSPLSELAGLEHLALHRAYQLQDLSGLSGLSGLRRLEIVEAGGLVDLSPLTGLSGLERLTLRDAWTLTDTSPLRELPALAHLDLRRCVRVSGTQRGIFRNRAAVVRALGG